MKVSLKQLVMYAGASGDFNEIHYNFDTARNSGFERPIVHGMLSMAMCINELMRKKGISPFEIKRVKARFKAPILMEEEISFNVEEETKESKEGKGNTTFIVRCEKNQSGVVATECEIEIKK